MSSSVSEIELFSSLLFFGQIRSFFALQIGSEEFKRERIVVYLRAEIPSIIREWFAAKSKQREDQDSSIFSFSRITNAQSKVGARPLAFSNLYNFPAFLLYINLFLLLGQDAHLLRIWPEEQEALDGGPNKHFREHLHVRQASTTLG